MDPHSVLGVPWDATDEELANAYRDLAKRHHPDHAGEADQARMQQINEAYEAARALRRANPAFWAERERAARRVRPVPGGWLAPELRRALGPELLGSLEEHEDVLLTTWAASRDSHEVRLVITDRRLLWLRDDAINHRLRWLRYSDVASVETRTGRWRGRGELRVRAKATRNRLSFGELELSTLRDIVQALTQRLPYGVVAPLPR